MIQPKIAAHIEQVGDFSSGLAPVRGQGYINESGSLVIPQKDLRWLGDFSEGLAQASMDDPNRQFRTVEVILDLNGRVVAKLPSFLSEYSEGLAAYEAEGKPGLRSLRPGNLVYRDYPGLKGFLDKQGNVAIKAEFAEVGPLRNERARAVLDGYCHIATPGW